MVKKSMDVTPNVINENEFYLLREIVAMNLGIKYLESEYFIKRMIETKKLKAFIVGKHNQGKRYTVKGSWLIKFLANFDDNSF